MKFCPQCHRSDQEPDCPMESLPGFHCPEPVEEDANTIVLACGVCGWLRGVPAGDLVKGLPSNAKLPPCRRDNCQAKLVRPEEPAKVASKGKTKTAGLGDLPHSQIPDEDPKA